MLKGDDVKTACQTACPTNAIVFGNAVDKESSVAKGREENKLRSFHVLEQLHVLPNVTYMAKIRNTDEEDSNWSGEHHDEGHDNKGDHMPAATKPEGSH
jgi:molybdopterin-containing oxidoreductase family iron-sulfur binding subunit